MKKKIIKPIIIVLIVILMLLPIIIDVFFNQAVKTIAYDDLETKIEETSYFGFALVYVTPKSREDIDERLEAINAGIEAFADSSASTSMSAYVLDYNKLSSQEREELLGDADTETAYLFISNGEIIKTVTEELEDGSVKEYISTYSANGINVNLVSYKVAEDAAAFKKLVNRKKTVTMAVFGKDSCFYCNQFQVVYNTVAQENGLDIYYFDSNNYDEDEYDKIMDMGLKIPASCSTTGEEVDLQPGFDTPLTLFTKNGKVIDCISGFVDKSTLETKLKTVGMLK